MIKHIQRLEEENEHLKLLKIQEDDNHLTTNLTNTKTLKEPSKEYEVSRRTIKRDLSDMWLFLQHQLESLSKEEGILGTKEEQHLKTIVRETKMYHDVIMADLWKLSESDGYKRWRKREAKSLDNLVQERIHRLQNPQECNGAKKLVCNLEGLRCGFGCQIHNIVFCLITSYGSERMLVLKSNQWSYYNTKYEDFLRPFSKSCRNEESGRTFAWPGTPDLPSIEVASINHIKPKPAFLPASIPAELAERLTRLHGDPAVWWVAQFVKYVMRLPFELQKVINATAKLQNMKSPVVGVHVRRTDKLKKEASFHGVEEYMRHVAEYYQELEVRQGYPVEEKRVYLATDDPDVHAACRQKFPHYVFLGDVTISRAAGVIDIDRKNANSLQGIIIDIYMLSLTDYLVGTFSSQVSRTAYEIMQTRFPDAADRFKSLDDLWYFGGGGHRHQEAVMNHGPRNEKELYMRKGDLLSVSGNLWNGFTMGKNNRTGNPGLYPSYKARERLTIVDFPT